MSIDPNRQIEKILRTTYGAVNPKAVEELLALITSEANKAWDKATQRIMDLVRSKERLARIDECERAIKRYKNQTGKSSMKVLLAKRIIYLEKLGES